MRETWSNSRSLLSDSPPRGTAGTVDGCVSEAADVSNSSSALAAELAVVIPAYRPDRGLLDLVRNLNPRDWCVVVIVDDGSGIEYAPVFNALASMHNVQVIRHAVNLGKGSALKTGINAVLCGLPGVCGVVTMDADGQHHPEDVRKAAQRFQDSPDALVLGVRDFQGAVPLRSRIGNAVTRRLMRVVVGQSLSDTQTGLRVIPQALLTRLLKVPAPGYEFEFEMLLAVKHLGIRVLEQPIRTIYEPGNPSSHFQPLRDSMRIYFVLLRFAWIGALTAVLDNFMFYLLFLATSSIGAAQVGARLVAVLFNYTTVRSTVFLSEERHQVLLPRYLLLVAVNAALSYAGIRLLHHSFSLEVLPAKIVIEALLFVANFLLQRDFVFTRRPAATAVVPTDWDRYYQRVPLTAHLTRRYTLSVLTTVLRRFVGKGASLVEIGGANSCFLDGLVKALQPRLYHVIDRNAYGLSLLRERLGGRPDVILHEGDVLNLETGPISADAVFSVGLIEHFDKLGTRRAIQTHFDLLPFDGIAVISFPTPTWLYVAARSIVEPLGMWHFTDERPLEREEVRRVAKEFGAVLFEKTLWPLVFTQCLIVVRKGRAKAPDEKGSRFIRKTGD